MRVAFCGLGRMGAPMATNLAAAGHDVVGFDVSPQARRDAEHAGLDVADDPARAVAGADAVVTMFQTGAQVLEAYRGGLLAAAAPDTLFVDSSTIAVDDAREAHRLAAEAGHRSLDAPVSGGVVGAQAATLAFMVGGTADTVAAAMPLFEAMGGRVVHCGGEGLGQAAKVCNNMLLAVSQIAVAEAFVLGERLGLSHGALYDVAAHASGQCWALTVNCPVPGPVPSSPANRDFAPGFTAELMAKDLDLAGVALDLVGLEARMGRLAGDMYRAFATGPGAGRDFSGIIDTVRGSTGPHEDGQRRHRDR